MKFKALSKKLLIAFFLFVLLVTAGATLGWRLLNSEFIETKLNKLILSLPSCITLHTDKITVEKHFPYISVATEYATLNYKNKLLIKAKKITDKVSAIKFITSYLTRKTYYGNIRISSLHIKYKQKTGGNANMQTDKNFYPPVLPVDVSIDKLYVSYGKINLTGTLKGLYLPLADSYKLKINGLLNNIPLIVKTSVNKNSLMLTFRAKTKKIYGLNIENIEGTVYTEKFNFFKIKLKSSYFAYKSVAMDNPQLAISFHTAKKGIKIENLNLQSSNNYAVLAKGFIDKTNYLSSNVEGMISTPYVDIKPFLIYIPKNIKDYIIKGYVSLSDIEFSGKPSLKFIKKGSVYAKSFVFRIDKKSSVFFIKQGKVEITPEFFTASAKGHFEDVLFDNSVIKIHRTKGYPCDMDLKYHGVANDLARIFLEENIFSKNDLKVLGKTSALKGKFSATTEIRDYRWKAEPFFNFDIVIHSNGVEFYNSNIPSKFIQSWGIIEIKRVVKNTKVKTLFVKLRDLKAKGFASNISTKEFTIFIKPKIALKGSFNAELSRNDTNYLINALMSKRADIVKNKVKIKANLNGELTDFSYKAEIKYTYFANSNKLPLNAYIKGNFNSPNLIVNSLHINNNIEATGKMNMKTFFFNVKLNFNDLNIKTLKAFALQEKNMPIEKGIINGSVSVTGDLKQPLKKINGNLSLKSGYISKDINSINANALFNNDTAIIDNMSVKLFKQTVYMQGKINYKNGISVDITSKTDNLTVDVNRINTGKNEKKRIYLKLPKIDLSASLIINNLYIKDKNREKNTGKTEIVFYNNPKTGFLKLKSKRTNITITRTNKHIKVHIKDYSIFPFITKCNRKDNMFELSADLNSQYIYKFGIDTLKGNVEVFAKNGEFKNVSNALKIVSATNIFEIIFGKTKPQKDLPYKKIIARLTLNKGVLKTRQNDIAALYGDNLNIFAKGKYDIMKKYIDIYATFTTLRSINKLVSKIPVIGWIIGGKQKSFTGINFHIKGEIGKKISVKPVPLKGLGEGFLGILKRALLTPFKIIGVTK